MKYSILLVTLFMGLSCSKKLSPDAKWNNNPWIVVEINGVPVEQGSKAGDAFISFNPSTKRFNGNGGCNIIGGNYSVNNNTIIFSEVLSTKMSCYDIEFENTFLTILNSVDHFDIKNNDLILKKGEQIKLVLRTK